MRWVILLIFVYLFLVIELGVSVALNQPGQYNYMPGLLLILAVYVGLFAPTMMTLWTWLALGILHDLAHPVKMVDATMDATIIGPAALAYLAGGFLMLQLRRVVYRGSPLSIAIFSFIAGIVVHLLIVLLHGLRGLSFLFLPGEHIEGWSWSAELVERFLSMVVTFFVALPVGWFLIRAGTGIFGSDAPKNGMVRR